MRERSDELEALLDRTAPNGVPISRAVEAELGRMAVAARTETPGVAVHRVSRLATAGIIAAVVFGGAGAAAAAVSVHEWFGWEKNPDRIYEFTLPSGDTCETRLGVVTGDDSRMVAAVKDYIASVDLGDAIDVPSELERRRADTNNWTTLPDGTEEYSGYGSDLYPDPDEEYKGAVSGALVAAVVAHLKSQGLGANPADWSNLTYSGRTQCSGDEQ